MDVGIPELIIILVIVVLLWGPGRLSKIGGELGSGIKAFREGLSTDEVDSKKNKAAESLSAFDQKVESHSEVEPVQPEQIEEVNKE